MLSGRAKRERRAFGETIETLIIAGVVSVGLIAVGRWIGRELAMRRRRPYDFEILAPAPSFGGFGAPIILARKFQKLLAVHIIGRPCRASLGAVVWACPNPPGPALAPPAIRACLLAHPQEPVPPRKPALQPGRAARL